MEKLAIALMSWAAAHTGLPVPDELPDFRFYDRCEIERYYFDDGSRQCAEDGSGVQAVYDYRINTVFLRDDWAADDIFHVSTLMHELIHHMQHHAGLNSSTVECPAEQLEGPAYKAQIDFLNASGLDAHEVMGINPLFLFFTTRCLHDARRSPHSSRNP